MQNSTSNDYMLSIVSPNFPNLYVSHIINSIMFYLPYIAWENLYKETAAQSKLITPTVPSPNNKMTWPIE